MGQFQCPVRAVRRKAIKAMEAKDNVLQYWIWLHVNQLYDHSTMTKCFYSLNSGRRPWLATELPELSPARKAPGRAPAPKGLDLGRWRVCPSIIFSFMGSEAHRKEIPNFCSARSSFQGGQMLKQELASKAWDKAGDQRSCRNAQQRPGLSETLLAPSLVH